MSEIRENKPQRLGFAALRRVASVVGLYLVMGALLFFSAGRLDWGAAWIWMGAHIAILVVNGLILARLHPEVVNERGKKHEGTRRFDKVVTAAITPFYFGLPVIAGLDAVRFVWAPLPDWTVWPGLVLLGLSDVFILWAMVVNRHLETTVRIQEEREHRVVSTGPYRIVRHPMYTGMCVQFLSWPLLLGSGWAFVAALAVIALFVVRTVFEDRMLREELPGYAEYAGKTQYRLVPGGW
jgi:protein-S-isoprenylcysteine O-methyltransferase Ste14